ncbi:MAG: hypothetical protein E6R03_03850 [Hyphomicrobiaceae bacterium]|nr:MAG: hypothetical protein E6R03_03850 [Hyphomicrobiaceae bacterium]
MASRNAYIQNASATPIGTRRHPGYLVKASYSTNASFSTLTTTLASITEPAESASVGVIYMGDFNYLTLTPTGTDADNETHSRRVFGIRAIESLSTGLIVGYQRVLLASYTLANCATTVSTSINGNQSNAFYCDTISSLVTYARDPAGFITTSNSADNPCSITFDTTGFPVIEIEYALNSGSGVAMNDFYTKF